jgi:hypothetical protein
VCGEAKCSLVDCRLMVGLHCGIGTERQRVEDTPRYTTNLSGLAVNRLAYQNNLMSDEPLAQMVATMTATFMGGPPRATSLSIFHGDSSALHLDLDGPARPKCEVEHLSSEYRAR